MRLQVELEINKLKQKIEAWRRKTIQKVNDDASAMTLFVEGVASRIFEMVDPKTVDHEKKFRVIK
jgi:hypothetical protein